MINLKNSIRISVVIFCIIQSCSPINNKIDKTMDRKYYMNTSRGYYEVTNKIIEDGYQYVDENRLINPKPMIFDYKELQWFKENLYDFAQKNYPQLSKEILVQLKTISIEELKSRPYIFTAYSDTFDEDVYLLKLKIKDEIYNIYMIKFSEMEGVYYENEIVNHKLVSKVRLEGEDWYRNIFTDNEEYLKNKY